MYYYFARITLQWTKLNPKPEFRTYMESFLQRYKRSTAWEDFDFSLEHLVIVHDSTRSHQFREDDKKCVYHDSKPDTSSVARASGDIRDRHIISEICKLWEKGQNIFIVYGSGHAIKQEPVLRELLR